MKNDKSNAIKNIFIAFNILISKVFKLRTKIVLILILCMIIPTLFISMMMQEQSTRLANELKTVAINDSKRALNHDAVANIERVSTDTALKVAEFLYGRDADILLLAALPRDKEIYENFAENKYSRLMKKGIWDLNEDGTRWVRIDPVEAKVFEGAGVSTNRENNDSIIENDEFDGFHYMPPEAFEYENIPLYDEVTFIDLDGNEIIKYVTQNSTKKNYPLNAEIKNVSDKKNTYVKAEDYFKELKELKVVSVINFKVDEKNQLFKMRLDPKMPKSIIGDDQRIA